VAIIKKREKGLSGTSDEIEIDFAQLQNSTLRALQEFVASTKNPKKKKLKKSAALTAEEKQADLERRLANVNSQVCARLATTSCHVLTHARMHAHTHTHTVAHTHEHEHEHEHAHSHLACSRKAAQHTCTQHPH
jgi:hypothetical protein